METSISIMKFTCWHVGTLLVSISRMSSVSLNKCFLLTLRDRKADRCRFKIRVQDVSGAAQNLLRAISRSATNENEASLVGAFIGSSRLALRFASRVQDDLFSGATQSSLRSQISSMSSHAVTITRVNCGMRSRLALSFGFSEQEVSFSNATRCCSQVHPKVR